MKKKLIAGMMTAMMILSVTACGKKAETAAETTTAGTPALESKEADAALSAEEVERKNEQAAALEEADYKGFAEKIQKAFADKDAEALAELTAYPVYVEIDGGVIVENKEQLKEAADEIFTEELMKAVAGVDVSKLEVVQAGVVMSAEEGTPGVTFASDEEGNMGITGITPTAK